jgi:hypothetical protein
MERRGVKREASEPVESVDLTLPEVKKPRIFIDLTAET